VVHEEEWRQGKVRAFALAFGNNKINVHTPALWQDPESPCEVSQQRRVALTFASFGMALWRRSGRCLSKSALRSRRGRSNDTEAAR
jgi:hypothetical protein